MGASSGSVRFLCSAAILLALGSGLASCLVAQQPLAVPVPRSEASQAIDPILDGSQLYDGQLADPSDRRPRYAEPPLPPVDYWQPTWMPCQSLRTNRSLVLGHLYWGADILGWATKGVHVPPLVTSGSLASGGVIGQGDTAIRFGNDFQLNSMTPGGRLTIGWWFNPNQYTGIEWHYFELDNRNTFTGAVADGSSVLARPFLNGGVEDAALTASDTRLNASVLAATDFQLTSTGIVFRDLLWASPFARLDYLAGYRHTHFFDRVRVDEKFTAAAGDPDFNDGDRVTRVDQFRTINQFDGLDLGFKGWWSNNGKLAVTSVSRFAIGANTNSALVNGYTRVGTGRNADTTNGGVLATPTTAVLRHGQTQFGTVTELGLGLSWQPGCFWKFNLGYTWFYWSEVARAASQIDRSGTTGADFHLHTTSFWAQGLNGGFTHQF